MKRRLVFGIIISVVIIILLPNKKLNAGMEITKILEVGDEMNYPNPGNLFYESSVQSLATVDDKGNIKALQTGNVTIKVYVIQMNKKKHAVTININIIDKKHDYIINGNEQYINREINNVIRWLTNNLIKILFRLINMVIKV